MGADWRRRETLVYHVGQESIQGLFLGLLEALTASKLSPNIATVVVMGNLRQNNFMV
jgi:hypothetical protein